MCLQFLCLLEPPFSLLARALPTLGSTSPVCAVWTARGLALWAGCSAIEAVRCEAGLKSSLCQMLRSDPIPGVTCLETSLLFARKWKIIGLSCASDYLVTSPPNIRKDNIYRDEILAHTQKRMSMILWQILKTLNFRKNGAVRNYFILKFSFKRLDWSTYL